MDKPLVNRVAQSNLVNINPEQFLPHKGEYATIDIKDFLEQEYLLKEKDFREQLENFDWSAFENKTVGIYCSNDAIIPQWAHMLITTYLNKYAKAVHLKSPKELISLLTLNAINQFDYSNFENKPVIIKGCGEQVTNEAYVAFMSHLLPVARSIMYGEACSTVPIFKQKKTNK